MDIKRVVGPKTFIRGALLAVILSLGGVMLVSCPPDGPKVPPASPTPPGEGIGLEDGYEAGDYDGVIHNATYLLDTADNESDILFARLYRGLAELGRQGDVEAAREDLHVAEAQLGQLNSDEQVLLFRGLMVAYARTADQEQALKYRDMVLEIAPDLEDTILNEFEDALP